VSWGEDPIEGACERYTVLKTCEAKYETRMRIYQNSKDKSVAYIMFRPTQQTQEVRRQVSTFLSYIPAFPLMMNIGEPLYPHRRLMMSPVYPFNSPRCTPPNTPPIHPPLTPTPLG
jgi:hypothetical protein